MGLFVEIAIEDEKFSTVDQREACAKACPVDIYELVAEHLVTVADREDECILCGLCIANAPSGALSVRRRYGRRRAVVAPCG